MRYRFLFSATLFLLVFICVLPRTSLAQPTYTVSPLVIDTTAEPRDIIVKKITLTNTGEQQVTVFPTVNNISVLEGGTIDAFLPPASSDQTASLSSWIEIKRLGIDLSPGEIKTIDLTLRINPSPKPGTYHAFVGFGYGRNRDEAESQVEGGRAPGTVISVSIEEKKSEFLRLSKFIVSRFVTKAENQAAVYTFSNPGDETVIPTGEIILYDTQGKEVGAMPVNPEGLSIPGGSEHVFINAVPTDGLFGKYKAFLTVEYGSTQRGSVQDTSFFYVFPLKTIFIFGIIVILVVILTSWYVHKKYFGDAEDDSDSLMFHIRESQSESKDHDLNLKQQ